MKRLGAGMVERGFAESREKAQRAIMAGSVRVNGQVAAKPSDKVKSADAIELTASEKYVSRGGLKLEKALEHFGIEVAGATAIDLGASTGGFTDCLLQHGAARVYAVDVGRGQLAWKLRQDPRVAPMEGMNARHLTSANFEAPFRPADLIVIDCSFISLEKILPAAARLLRSSGMVLALVKPQFEAGKAEADRGAGVIKDPEVHRRVLAQIELFVNGQTDLKWRGVVESPLLGPAGNKEFLALMEKIDPPAANKRNS